jgi:membrane fusion protein, multidrug efflux system
MRTTSEGLDRRAALVRSAAMAAFALAACRRSPPPAPPPPPPLVTAAAAATADVPVTLTEIGTCVARETVKIRAQVSGRIVGIHFEDGAEVAEGALLFTIESATYAAELARARAELQENLATLEEGRRELERMKSLVDQGGVSRQEVDARKSRVEVGEALVASSRAAIESAEVKLGWCAIRSPIAGRSGRRRVDVGNVVRPEEDAELLVLHRMDPLYVEFSIPEQELDRVRAARSREALRVRVLQAGAGQAAPSSEPSSDGDGNAQPVSGELTFIDSAVRRDTGTVLLRATVPNEGRRLWPGQFVKAELVLETLRNAVVAPQRAVQIAASGPYVYVVKPDSTAEMRPVVRGPRHGESVVIAKGLAAGERVITDGHLLVAPGAPVREAGAPKAP